MRKDKEKVVDEVWTDDRVKSFLQVRPHDEVEEDFHMLLKAYQSMRVEDFAKFIGYFLKDGRSLNSTNPDGESVLDIIDEHRRSTAYADILRSAGATT
jgi:hypothetical protein